MENYAFVRVLQKGGFGTVLLGVNRVSGEKVAVKRIEKARMASSDSIRKEYEIMRGLRHPSILKVIDMTDEVDYVSITMELADGGDLHDLLRRYGQIPEDVCRLFFKQTMRGMQFLHAKQIAHLDIKTKNILVMNDGTTKIADFGLSMRLQPGELIPGSQRKGTPSYWAPEIHAGQDFDGFSVDLWALGVTMYKIVTGRYPFQNMESLLQGQFDPPSTRVTPMCLRMMETLMAVQPVYRASLDRIMRTFTWLNVPIHAESTEAWIERLRQTIS